MKCNQQWKKLLALTLCIVQCAMLAIPAVSAQESAPEAMNATSVAVPEPTLSDVPVTVTMKEEVNSDGSLNYWWGNASQATVKLGDPITNISDRYSWIIDSAVEEGYGEKGDGTTDVGQTSNYFQFDAGWADFDMGNQDLMLYLELPEASSSIRMQHVCMDSWNKYPAPEGMTYQYLEADGNGWVQGVIDQNKQITLTAGFKGYVRLLLNTAPNATSYAESVLDLQTLAFRIDNYGGDFGAAKIGGVWFVDKGEGYEVIVDGGEKVALTTADPLPTPSVPDPVIPAWNGDILTGVMAGKEWNSAGQTAGLVSYNENDDPAWAGLKSQNTLTITDSGNVLGIPRGVIVDSPIREGYFSEDTATYGRFSLGFAWKKCTPKNQDLMFYMELPEAASSIRIASICCNGWAIYVNREGMQYQYLSMDSREWKSGTIDGYDQLNLEAGFKGFVRLIMSTATSATGTSDYLNTELSVQNIAIMIDKFGGSYGPAKFSASWVVSKEDSRYIRVDGGNTLCMTDPVERYYLEATTPNSETAAIGETSTLVSIGKGTDYWGIASQATAVAGESIVPFGNQKSVVLSSPAVEGYVDSRTAAIHALKCGNNVLDYNNQDIMFYVELPMTNTGKSSFRIQDITCNYSQFWAGPVGMHYQYLPVNGSEWSSGVADGNKQVNLPDGFKGYVRLEVNTASNVDKFPETLKITQVSLRMGAYGEKYGDLKFGGVWFVSKEDFIYIGVDNAEPACMVNPPEAIVLEAASVAVETPETIWLPKVSAAAGQVTTENSITKISDRKAVVINSESVANGTSVTVDVNAELAEDQDVMLYVELAADSKVLFNSAFAGITYKYLSINSGNWIEANSANGQISLPAGFKGYVRLAIAAGNVNTLNFMVDAFGGDKGAFKLGGVWFVSKSDALYASVDGADAVALGNLTDGLGLVEKWNVVLQDDIGVNFYIRVNENIRNTAQIKITVDGKSVSHAVSALTADANGSYKVKVDVSAAQMTSPICVQVVNDGQISAEKTYTVAQYAKTVLNSDDVGAYYHLIKEMLNYGGAAQTYFGINNHDMANAGLTGVAYNDVPAAAETQYSVSGSAAGVQLYGATLVLRNQVAVRIYFQISDDIAAHSFVCGDEALTPVKAGDKYYVEIDGINPQDLDENVTVTVDNGLTVSYSPMNYMVRMNQNGSESLKELIRALYNYHLAADRFVLAQDDPARYDLKVTTFNVGQWYHGVSNLDVYGAQVHAHPGITPDHVLRAYEQWMKAFPMHDADLIGMQEFRDIFYINNQDTEDTSDDVTMTALEVLDDYFGQVESFTSATKNDTIPMWMGMATPIGGRYQMKNITTGELCADTAYPRAYMKAYVTVNGHDIAIYSVHLQPSSVGGWEYRQLAYAELIELTKQDAYVIVMGDMNAETGAEEYKAMVEAGFTMANCGKFGDIDTYEYGEVDPIDNIFVTSNIEIVYAEAEPEKVGGSDHFPMSAYLVIKDEA